MKATRTEPIYTLEMSESEAILLMGLLGSLSFNDWKKHLTSCSYYGNYFDHIKMEDTDNFHFTLSRAGVKVPYK